MYLLVDISALAFVLVFQKIKIRFATVRQLHIHLSPGAKYDMMKNNKLSTDKGRKQ